MEWVKLVVSAVFLLLGMLFFVTATIGVNRYKHALNRMHAAALGDTLGIFFSIIALLVWKGFCMDSLKLFVIILFFWMASPVASHMISRLEMTTDKHLGEIEVEHHEDI